MSKSLSPRLRHRITIQSVTVSRDSVTGFVGKVWVAFASDVPAEVLTGAGREATALGQQINTIAARITIRWIPGVVKGMRVLHGSDIYHVATQHTDATGRRWLTLVCTIGAVEEG